MTATYKRELEEVGAFAGSASEVRDRLDQLSDNEKVQVLALTLPGPDDESMKAMTEALVSISPIVQRMVEEHRTVSFDSIVSAFVPRHVPTATALTEARMLAEAKATVINSKNYMTAKEIAEIAGYSGSNPSSQPNRWKRDKMIFAFNHCGIDYFPAYALDAEHGWKPYPAMAEILAIFDGEKGGWGCAFWFEGVNGYLGGKAPKDVLATDPARVIKAAALEMEPIAHA